MIMTKKCSGLICENICPLNNTLTMTHIIRGETNISNILTKEFKGVTNYMNAHDLDELIKRGNTIWTRHQ